jgi:hypothetical protein
MRMNETKVAGNDNKVDPNVIFSVSFYSFISPFFCWVFCLMKFARVSSFFYIPTSYVRSHDAQFAT